jgi:serine phosphatase RsbU (regulator of sigma subunit)
VAGHGVDAAFVTGIVKTLISRDGPGKQADPDFSPAGFLAALNAMILKELSQMPEILIAMSVAMMDRASGRLVMSNAGNLPVYRVRHDSCEIFSVSGAPCGSDADAVFEDLVVPIRPGDRIALMTDGLIERGRIEGWVKLDAVKALMRHFKDQPDFNKRLVQIVLEMLPDGKFHDDTTLITARVR